MCPEYRNCDVSASQPKALLLSLPWTTLPEPSLGLGLLKAVLTTNGVPCQVRHLNIEMLRFVKPVTYYTLANTFALNEFLFSGVLDPPVTPRQHRLLREKARQALQFSTIDAAERGGLDGFVRDLLHLRNNIIPIWL